MASAKSSESAKKPAKSAPQTKPAAPAKGSPAPAAAAPREPMYRDVSADNPPQSSNPVAAKIISHDDICRRAHELYQQGHPGGEMEHWLEAERQLKQ